MTDTGSDADYTAFVEAVWPGALRLARLLTGDRHRGEELVQDSLVTLYAHWRRISARGDPHAYLRRMLVNAHVSWWRRRRREHLTDEVPDRGDPHPVLPRFADDLDRALRRLPPHQRAVVVLRHYEDLSESAVAATLGCSVGTVKSQHARAMTRLRQELSTEERVHP